MTIPEERIERLHELARAAAKASNDCRAREYVRLARRIAMRNRVSFPREFKRFSCDACDRYLVPSKNARFRLHNGELVVTCDCGHIERYPYKH
jgi:ribonuclease P protein subunit RPR2